jgi:hypothetical protein
MIRVNLHSNNRRGKLPVWIGKLINVFLEKFAEEYDVKTGDAYRYHFENAKRLERLKKLFEDNNITVDTYSMEELPSWGLLIPHDNEQVVEYMLKYGTEKEET